MVNTALPLGPTLETERLILRPPVAADFDAYAAMMEDGEALTFIGGAMPRAAAWRSFAGMAGSWVLLGFGMFSVIEKSSGAWIGRIGPINPDGWPGTEVGWGLVRRMWGRGYAAEAAASAIDFAFDTLGWNEVIHCIDPKNNNSLSVARKLGSRHLRRGHLPAPINEDVDIWGQSREEWQGNRLKIGRPR